MPAMLSIGLALMIVAGAPASAACAVDPKLEVSISRSAEPPARIKAAREAIASARALSFEATVKSEGPAAAQSPEFKVQVSAARADAGGWRVAAKGASTGKDGKSTPLSLGYDAATAWAVRESEKVVVQKSVMSMTDLESFFREQGAQAAVPWMMLADEPLEIPGDAATEPDAEVDGVACEVFTFASSGGSDAGKTMTRIFIAKDDGLPRRFDRIRELPGKDGAAPDRNTQTLVLASLRKDAEAAQTVFTPPSPDGFAVRTAPARARRPRPEPDALRGPDVRDKGGMLGVGMLAPDWTLVDSTGKTHKLSDYRGKVVFMDFWATWCPPCRAAMPSVQRLHDHYRGKDVAVLGLNFNDTKPDAAAKYMASNGFKYPLLLNAEKLADQYKITGIPAFFIVGKDGRIVYTQTGFAGGNKAAEKAHDEKIMKIIDEALGGEKPVEGMMEGESKPGAK